MVQTIILSAFFIYIIENNQLHAQERKTLKKRKYPVSVAVRSIPSYTKLFCKDSTNVQIKIPVKVMGIHITVPHTKLYMQYILNLHFPPRYIIF